MVKIFNYQCAFSETGIAASLTDLTNIPHPVTVRGNYVPVQKAAQMQKEGVESFVSFYPFLILNFRLDLHRS
jgi:hypothetical protein